MSERAAPFYCPYCGEERLVPREEEGTWFCQDCVRSFRLKFLGVGAPQPTKENPR
ncbi:Insertion element protein [Actinomadura kijaniata]|uniref:Insertion element protein n=1 Tax=Actinomadura kijaniata TaxID=46161 RepID=UPI000835628B|nr:Insertion element protein [Actinomadura kijaniata]